MFELEENISIGANIKVVGVGGGGVALLLEDIRRAFVTGEQVGAVRRGDEGLEGMDPGEEAHEIVPPAEREDRVDQVVADTCFALLDF